MKASSLKARLKHTRKKLLQRKRRPLAKHASETMKATRSPYDASGLKEYPGD